MKSCQILEFTQYLGMGYQYLELKISDKVGFIKLARAKKANAICEEMWFELKRAIDEMDASSGVHVVILEACGKHFSSGIDLNFLKKMMEEIKKEKDPEEFLYQKIKALQECISAFSKTGKPVIALTQGACLGAGLDLISACDMRFAHIGTRFCVLETKLGIVADVGVLQRLNFLIPDAYAKELALSSRVFSALSAKKYGLLNKVFFTQKGMRKHAMKLAHEIASLPKEAVFGTKESLNDNTRYVIENGLEKIARKNAAYFLKADIKLTL